MHIKCKIFLIALFSIGSLSAMQLKKPAYTLKKEEARKKKEEAWKRSFDIVVVNLGGTLWSELKKLPNLSPDTTVKDVIKHYNEKYNANYNQAVFSVPGIGPGPVEDKTVGELIKMFPPGQRIKGTLTLIERK